MAEGFTVHLNGADIAVAPLTLGQIERISLSLTDEAGILQIALSETRPGITKADIQAWPCTRKELTAALRAVLTAGEFLPEKDAKQGEGAAGSA